MDNKSLGDSTNQVESLSIIYLFIILALMPYSILVPMIIGNSLYGLISCSIICPVIKRRITDSYEEAVKTSTSTY